MATVRGGGAYWVGAVLLLCAVHAAGQTDECVAGPCGLGQVCKDRSDAMGDYLCMCAQGTAQAVGGPVGMCPGLDECLHPSAAVLSGQHMPRYTLAGCVCMAGWEQPNAAGPCTSACCNPNGDPAGEWCKLWDHPYNQNKAGCNPGTNANFNSFADMWGYCLPLGAFPPEDGGLPAPRLRPSYSNIDDAQTNLCTDAFQTCKDTSAEPNNWKCLCPAPQMGGPGNQVTATDCTCPAGTVFPACRDCTSAADCNGNARSVTDDMNQRCVCTCEDGYVGADCGTCIAGWTIVTNTKKCAECMNNPHCSGNAVSVTSTDDRLSCACTCKPGYEGAACNVCAAGYVGYPNCVQCTVAGTCNNNAASVVDDGTRSRCVCTCKEGYTGATCDQCADMYVGYPNCVRCTVQGACNGNADSVGTDAMNTACVCSCSTGFAGAGCTQCAAGYIGYPLCSACTNAQHCNDGAVSVTDDGMRSSCVCNCQAGYGGARCGECAPGYSGTYPTCVIVTCTIQDTCSNRATAAVVPQGSTTCECTCMGGYEGAACNMCAAGYVGFPNCRQCTAAADCTNNAVRVTTDAARTMCMCECAPGFAGAACDRCDVGFIGYPGCRKCDLGLDCTSNAWSVTDDGTRTTCLCDCMPMFTGDACNQCARGYINYPDCTQCSLATDCNFNARIVTDDGTRTSCVCDCKRGFAGPNCDRCARGFITYPNCYECDIHQHCNSNALSTTDDGGNDRCVCDCKTGYAGAECQECAPGYTGYPTCEKIMCRESIECNGNTVVNGAQIMGTVCECSCRTGYEGDRCEMCAEGYIGYPSCRLCSVQTACSGNAMAVTDDGTRRECTCDCMAGYEGTSCETCAVGYIDYPRCFECTIPYHCKGNALAVTDDGIRSGCVCDCKTGYEGVSCGHCAAGYITYPECNPCTNEVHCNNNAASVMEDGTRTGCMCTCRVGFDGPTCDRCADGYINYPQCALCEDLTRSGYCNGNAVIAVQDPAAPLGCACTCTANYTGTTCDQCAPNFFGYPMCRRCTSREYCNDNAASATQDTLTNTCTCACNAGYAGAACDMCAAGYVGYPMCNQCSAIDDCNANAAAVTDDGNRTSCVCTCREAYVGDACEDCAPGYFGYPTCRQCTNAGACSGNAVNVTDDGLRNGCVCDCMEGYAGATCNMCDEGYFGYPTCTMCNDIEHCSGNSVDVTDNGLRTGCRCTCKDGWAGIMCNTCEANVAPAGACNTCRRGFINFPVCERCTSDVHCSGNAQSVLEVNGSSCMCMCNTGFAGDACDMCATGYINYPQCTPCTSATACNGNAVFASDDGTRQICQCSCKDGYTGNTCDMCAPAYFGYPDCAQCNAAQHCNGNADSVRISALGDRCDCTCKPAYTGDACDACAAGMTNYPQCVSCGVAMACNNNALLATLDATGTMCNCTCNAGYGGVDCGRCADGFTGYPACVEVPPTPVPDTGRGLNGTNMTNGTGNGTLDGNGTMNGNATDATNGSGDGNITASMTMTTGEPLTSVPVTAAPARGLPVPFCVKDGCALGTRTECTIPTSRLDVIRANVMDEMGIPRGEQTADGVDLDNGLCVESPTCPSGSCRVSVTPQPQHQAKLEECNRALDLCPRLGRAGFVGAAGGDDDDGGSDFPWWVFILVGVLCCLLLIALLMKKKSSAQDEKRRKEAQAQKEAEMQATATTDPTTEGLLEAEHTVYQQPPPPPPLDPMAMTAPPVYQDAPVEQTPPPGYPAPMPPASMAPGYAHAPSQQPRGAASPPAPVPYSHAGSPGKGSAFAMMNSPSGQPLPRMQVGVSNGVDMPMPRRGGAPSDVFGPQAMQAGGHSQYPASRMSGGSMTSSRVGPPGVYYHPTSTSPHSTIHSTMGAAGRAKVHM